MLFRNLKKIVPDSIFELRRRKEYILNVRLYLLVKSNLLFHNMSSERPGILRARICNTRTINKNPQTVIVLNMIVLIRSPIIIDREGRPAIVPPRVAASILAGAPESLVCQPHRFESRYVHAGAASYIEERCSYRIPFCDIRMHRGHRRKR